MWSLRTIEPNLSSLYFSLSLSLLSLLLDLCWWPCHTDYSVALTSRLAQATDPESRVRAWRKSKKSRNERKSKRQERGEKRSGCYSSKFKRLKLFSITDVGVTGLFVIVKNQISRDWLFLSFRLSLPPSATPLLSCFCILSVCLQLTYIQMIRPCDQTTRSELTSPLWDSRLIATVVRGKSKERKRRKAVILVCIRRVLRIFIYFAFLFWHVSPQFSRSWRKSYPVHHKIHSEELQDWHGPSCQCCPSCRILSTRHSQALVWSITVTTKGVSYE